LQRSLLNLTHRLENLGLAGSKLNDSSDNQNTVTSIPDSTTAEAENPAQANAAVSNAKNLQVTWTGDPEVDSSEIQSESPSPAVSVTAPVNRDPAAPSLFSRLRDQWMIWLGALSIGLSGIFMVRYSIEQGLLGPMVRVSLSILTGLILHCVAEWGRRRSVAQFQALAVLAGDASILRVCGYGRQRYF
jgi:uncharacterized membrane protein